MGGLESLLSKLPGIKGYREKDIRRDSDKQLRDSLARELSERRTKITALQNDLLAGGGLLWLDDVEKLVSRLQLLIDRIKTAAYGYAGFFDIQRVKEEELDKLAQFDEALFEDLPRLDTAIESLAKAVEANEGIKEAISAIGAILTRLNEMFSKRLEAIREP
jgi:DNA repair exonuclease SbcCD ATPase subunit